MTKRANNQTTTQTKPVWKCRTATNFGIENCPHSKSIDEAIIENAFLEMFHLLADNFDDVLDSVILSHVGCLCRSVTNKPICGKRNRVYEFLLSLKNASEWRLK